MSTPERSRWRTRLVEYGFPDRSFDIEFWQEQGDEANFAATLELVEIAEKISHSRKPTLQRLLQLLNQFQVEYLIVGGFAVMKYGEPRYTTDLDVWIHNSPENSLRVVAALQKFGAPLDHDGVTEGTLSGKQVVYQIGVAPVGIDILTEITGVQFPDAWIKRVASTFFGIPVHFISLDDLVTNKQAMGRSMDVKDLRKPKSTNQQK